MVIRLVVGESRGSGRATLFVPPWPAVAPALRRLRLRRPMEPVGVETLYGSRDLKRLPGQPLDILEGAAFRRVAEGIGDAAPPRAGGAADSVDIALGVHRQLVIDHVA